jgi:glycosidase
VRKAPTNKPLLYTAIGALSLAVPFACGSGDELMNHSYGQPSLGGSGPGVSVGTGPSGGTGAGSGASFGAGGTGGSGPPMCDDSLKRCPHTFSYTGMGNETTVEVRGSFAPNGWTSGVMMTKTANTWSASVPIPYNQDVQYKFLVNGTNWITDPNNPNRVSDGLGGENSDLPPATCASWTCASVPPSGDLDWSSQILYFVFVDRWNDGNPANNGAPVPNVPPAANWQGGDYAGVTQKIQAGYFTDLGVTALWITVPMQNPDVAGLGTDGKLYSAYHGYWPMILDQTEPRFGTMAELQGLVSAAHAAKLKVIFDYAMHHVHVSAPVYTQNPSWFWPNNYNGQSCVCGSGNCPWDGPTATLCWFADYLPTFNFTSAQARQFSVQNALFWVQQTGADGFRLDAVKQIDSSWIVDMRTAAGAMIEPMSMKHFYMVGETFTGDQNLIKSYVDPATKLDGQFDFPLRQHLLTSLLIKSTPLSDLEGFMSQNDGFYGPNAIMSTFIGNHDVPRAIHFGEDQPLWTDPWADGKDRNWSNQPSLPGGTRAFERLANVFTILLTTKGIPLIYYGDEVGMPGAGDPDNRRFMEWSTYTAGQALLLGRIKKLTALRKAHKALFYGTRTTLSITNDTWAYQTVSGADTVYVALNRSDSPQAVTGLPSGPLTDQLGAGAVMGPSVMVPPRSSMVLTP